MVRIAAELGMTPSSRTRIRVGDKPPEDPSRPSSRTVARATRRPGHRLCAGVAEGQILTNRLVRLACARHLADLGSAGTRGLRFDLDAARHAIDFFGFLRHSKGEWAGKTFALAAWQAPWSAACSAGDAQMASGASAPPMCGAEEERQEHALGRDRALPAPRRRRAGRRGLFRRDHPRSGADRVRRGQAHGPEFARAAAPGRRADQQPERRGQRIALHAAVLRCQLRQGGLRSGRSETSITLSAEARSSTGWTDCGWHTAARRHIECAVAAGTREAGRGLTRSASGFFNEFTLRQVLLNTAKRRIRALCRWHFQPGGGRRILPSLPRQRPALRPR